MFRSRSPSIFEKERLQQRRRAPGREKKRKRKENERKSTKIERKNKEHEKKTIENRDRKNNKNREAAIMAEIVPARAGSSGKHFCEVEKRRKNAQ